MIDIATLTGACIVALGKVPSAVLGNNRALIDGLIRSGQQIEDKIWELPLWDEYRIKPVINIRNCWQESDDDQGTRVLEGMTNVIYDYRGNVSCCCLVTGEVRAMAYGGFEESRQTLKYRCPARHYGVACRGEGECPLSRAIRIKLVPESPDTRGPYVPRGLQIRDSDDSGCSADDEVTKEKNLRRSK